MIIREMSDLHLEFSGGDMCIPFMPDEKDQVLVLAGDICVAKKKYTYVDFIRQMSLRFREVIMILGNHEHYKGSFIGSHNRMWTELVEFENVHVLNKEALVIDDVAFVCATLWTDFDRGNAMVMNDAQRIMRDYKVIRTGPSMNDPYRQKLNPIDLVQAHMEERDWIFEEIAAQKAVGNKVVVVTHHAPSWKSVHAMYKANYAYACVNGCYASELDEQIMVTKPDLWFHGHTHHTFDYMIEDTRVMCNPRGYYKVEENPEFNSEFVFEV